MRNADGIFRRTVEFGRWQQGILFVLVLAASMVDNFNGFSMVFLAYEPPHLCDANATALASNISLMDFDSYEARRRGAELFEAKECSVRLVVGGSGEEVSVPCSSWEWDRGIYSGETLVTEFGLVCDQAIYSSVIISVLELATIGGGFLFAWLMDSYGRRRALVLNVGTYSLFAFLSSFAPGLLSFTLIRCVAEMNALSTFNIAYVWALETVGPSKRTLASTLFYIGGALGKMAMALVALAVPSWRWMSLGLSVPCAAFLLCCWLPESPGWLLGQGRDAEALEVLRLICADAVSEEELSDVLDADDTDEEASSASDISSDLDLKEREPSALDLVREPRLRWKTALLCVAFLAVMTVSDTIAFNTENLSGNFLVVWALQSSVQAPAVLLNAALLNRYGRIWPLVGAFLLTALFCALSIPAGRMFEGLTSIFSIVANFFIFTAEGIVYQLGTEEFPTVLRGLGLGLTTVVGDLGVLAMPYIVYTDNVSSDIPMLILFVLSFLGALAVLFLPETKGKRLPQSIQEGLRAHTAGLSALRANLGCCSGEAAEEDLAALLVATTDAPSLLSHSAVSHSHYGSLSHIVQHSLSTQDKPPSKRSYSPSDPPQPYYAARRMSLPAFGK